MKIETEDDLAGMKAAGRVVRETLDAMSVAVEPGISTAQLDAIAARALRDRGARSAPRLVYDFPGETCICVNDEIVHGIPSAKRVLREGDLVTLDVTIEKNGYMADAAVTLPVGRVSARAAKLLAATEAVLTRALEDVRPGKRAFEVGRVIEREAGRHGLSPVRALQGHGIGRTIHEDPMMPNWADPEAQDVLEDGLVLTVEPILSLGSGESYESNDGWTILAADGAWAAHFEHTLVVTKGRPILLTA
ncbi:MAG: type I methionyl aminopeptidase [Candidatus Eisenbacteria bacterium]|jgi:methionyl aminopeptidase|nr:type I methionyl aminopeptidase [Candidatus Eisenbacteria bacterium]